MPTTLEPVRVHTFKSRPHEPHGPSRWEKLRNGIDWTVSLISQLAGVMLVISLIMILLSFWHPQDPPTNCHRCTHCQKDFQCRRHIKQPKSQTLRQKPKKHASVTVFPMPHPNGNNPSFARSRLSKLYPPPQPKMKKMSSDHEHPEFKRKKQVWVDPHPNPQPYRQRFQKVAAYETTNVSLGGSGAGRNNGLSIPISTPSNQRTCCATAVGSSGCAQFCSFLCYTRFRRANVK